MSIEKIAQNTTSIANKTQIVEASKISNKVLNGISALDSNHNLPRTTVDVFEKQGGAKNALGFMQFIKSAIRELLNK